MLKVIIFLSFANSLVCGQNSYPLFPGDNELKNKVYQYQGVGNLCNGAAKTLGVCSNTCEFGKAVTDFKCKLGQVCCSELKSCGKTAKAKMTHFIGENFGINPPALCNYKISILSKHICQIRLDFLSFSLSNPVDNSVLTTSPACSNDSLIISPSVSNQASIPTLCGHNAGQHIYLNIPEGAVKDVTLQVPLSRRTLEDNLPYPNWVIRATKIECSKTINSVSPRLDKILKAPNGCLQYYTEPDGTIESFNYNQGSGPYMGGLDYSICFDTNNLNNYCGIEFTPASFEVGGNGKAAYDADCKTDYVEFSSQAQVDGKTIRRVCNKLTSPVVLSGPTPWSVHFHSEKKTTPYPGFRFHYRYLSVC